MGCFQEMDTFRGGISKRLPQWTYIQPSITYHTVARVLCHESGHTTSLHKSLEELPTVPKVIFTPFSASFCDLAFTSLSSFISYYFPLLASSSHTYSLTCMMLHPQAPSSCPWSRISCLQTFLWLLSSCHSGLSSKATFLLRTSCIFPSLPPPHHFIIPVGLGSRLKLACFPLSFCRMCHEHENRHLGQACYMVGHH